MENPFLIEREELSMLYGLPVFCYIDHPTWERVYVTRGGWVGDVEICRQPLGAICDYAAFLDKEIALMERLAPEDWSI